MSAWVTGLLLFLGLYVAAAASSPFPYWRTYWVLWRAVLFAPGTLQAKRRQTVFLIKAGAGAPLWTLFWYLDEILYPDYRRRDVQPVFIVGQPRCGSTFLHRTLAADNGVCFAVKHIEWRYPFISLQKLIQRLGLDKNLGGADYWPDTDAGRLAAKMHPNTLADWEEDGIFFEENFLHHFFIFLRFPYPGLLSYVDSFPELPPRIQKRMLDVYVKTLKKIQYLRGPESLFYLSKEVTSHKRIPALLEVFPAARFIVIVRPAQHFMSSLSALMRMSTRSKTGGDPGELAWWREEFMGRMQADSRRLVGLCRDVIPIDQQVRVSSNLFVNEPAQAVALIYRELKLDISERFAAHLALLKKRQEERQRGYDYDQLRLEGFEEYDAFVREIDQTYINAQPMEPALGQLG